MFTKNHNSSSTDFSTDLSVLLTKDASKNLKTFAHFRQLFADNLQSKVSYHIEQQMYQKGKI